MTVTSNIHIGLSAWAANHVYTLGQRVSNGGNAYQITTAGTSAASGGPTGTGGTISDGSAVWKYLSAIDYTSLGSWTSSIPSTLTQNIVGQLWNDSLITTTSGVPFFTLSGHTTGSFTITLKCAPGESFVDVVAGQSTALAYNASNGVAFQLPGSGVGSTNYVSISDDNVILDGLQFKDPNSGSDSTILSLQGASPVLQKCIFDGYSQLNSANIIEFTVYSGANIGIMRNCLVVDRAATSASQCFSVATSIPNVHVVNTTLVAVNAPTNVCGFVQFGTSGALTVTNCIIIGYTAANAIYQPNGGTVTAQYSLFSNAAAGLGGTNGTGNLFSKSGTNQFQNATSDFRLKTGSSAIDAGTTDSSDIPAANDIAGSTRPSGSAWDIGAWEFVQAPASVSITGTNSPAALGTLSGNIPSRALTGQISLAQTGVVLVQNINVATSMFIFHDGNIPSASQFNGNFANCVDKSTATPQSMAASLTTAGSLQAANIVTPGMLSVLGGWVVGVNVMTTTGNYSMQPTDYVFIVNKAVSATTTVVLPGSPAQGRVYTVMDGSGLADRFPVTIQASQNIASYSNYVLREPFASVSFVFSGSQWYVISGVGSFNGTVLAAPGATRTTNTASGAASIAMGSNNTASGQNSIAAGATNTATGAQSVALGNNSTATGNGSFAAGTFANDRGRIGQFAFSGGRLGINTGDSQYGVTTLRKTIPATTTSRLTVDGAAANATNCCNLVNGIAYGFGQITIVAYDAANVHAAMWTVTGLLVVRGINAAATALIGTPTITLLQASSALSALSSGSVTVTADTTNGGINISLNNASSVSLDVVAVLHSAEIF